jgi:hypothetical protein
MPKSRQKRRRFGERFHEVGDGAIPAGQRFELRHVIWVREKAYVEHEIGIARHPELEAERDDADR